MMEVAAIDRGNSRTKYARFVGNEIVESGIIQSKDQLAQLLSGANLKFAVSDVTGTFPTNSGSTPIHFINYSKKIPIKIKYPGKENYLGVDRIANACGASFLYPKQNVLVIDAGSCVTCEVINAQREFIGGCISPGWKMRLSSMHQFTGQLPLLENEIPKNSFPFVGTGENMQGASFFRLVAELNFWINEFKKQYPEGKVVITGGDAEALQKALKNDIFADPNLTLRGIFNIFNYQYA